MNCKNEYGDVKRRHLTIVSVDQKWKVAYSTTFRKEVKSKYWRKEVKNWWESEENNWEAMKHYSREKLF